MSELFKFAHHTNIIEENSDLPTVYYLKEHKIVEPQEAKRFVVKKRIKGKKGLFREFFGVINDLNYHLKHPESPVPNLPFLEEEATNLYNLYHLNIDKVLHVENKDVDLYIMKDFLEVSPKKFGGMNRTPDAIAQHAEKRRNIIYDYYKSLDPHWVATLTEANLCSCAYIYLYLNNSQPWEEGMEWTGYTDGLFEVGGYLSISIDTNEFDVHTSLHEISHAISYFFIDSLFYEWYDIAQNQTESPPTDYARSECSEDVAESLGFYLQGGQNRLMLKEKCPKRYEFCEKVDRLKSKALVPILKPTSELTERFAKYDAKPWG